ncbi:MAG: hypothetical protein OEZ59_13895 [Deltaproteobacteria bacterium]|nr:hypothetical protein [Deltaproteobacteria bacterium]
MTQHQDRLEPGGWRQYGPLLVALGYGLAFHLPQGASGLGLYWQSPLMFSILAGLVMALTCRPVLSRIPWSRGSALLVGALLLLGAGLPADWLAAWLLEAGRLASFPLNMRKDPSGALLGALVAAALMAWVYRPARGPVTLDDLWRRIRSGAMASRLARLAALGALAVVVQLLVAWADARWEEGGESIYIRLVHPNPWLRLEGILERGGDPGADPGGFSGALLFCAVLWLRGMLAVLPLLPVSLALKGRWSQLALVYASLLFVLGEFAPLMMDQPYPSGGWLIARTGLGLFRSAVLGGAMAALIRLPPPRQGGAPGGQVKSAG